MKYRWLISDIATTVFLLAASNLSYCSENAWNIFLTAPWDGRKTISQGNHGSTSHNIAEHRSVDRGNHNWENTYAIDVAMPPNSPVIAAGDGVVALIDNDPCGASGRYIAIKHDNQGEPDLHTVYMHLSRITTRSGEAVKRGQTIAYSGGSSNCKDNGLNPHLHFHVWGNKGSLDSSTQPIGRLVLHKDNCSQSTEYDSRKGMLDDNAIARQSFTSCSNQPPEMISYEISGNHGITLNDKHEILIDNTGTGLIAHDGLQIISSSNDNRYLFARSNEWGNGYILYPRDKRAIQLPYPGKYGFEKWGAWSTNNERIALLKTHEGTTSLYVAVIQNGHLSNIDFYHHIGLPENIYSSLEIDKSSVKWIDDDVLRANFSMHCGNVFEKCTDTQAFPSITFKATIDVISGEMLSRQLSP